ncbi:MAG TPA: TonB-dependent receptor plug domain-containing protein, partial [Stenotrophomonas sp.]|nr:TonB-dependent receptor plug domain-containing protein [Stenotrophomonas sp.]
MQRQNPLSHRHRLAVSLSCVLLSPFAALAEQAPGELDQIIVTASRTAQTQDQALAPVTVIDRAQIERRQAQTLPDLLRGEPGVSLVNSGGPGKNTSLFLRGTES